MGGRSNNDEEVMMCLLEEELRLYKEQTGDTAQEALQHAL